jgi:hypothetical protein
MPNIPLLNKQNNAQSQTQITDTSKLVNAQQSGIREFGNNLQKIVKNTTSLIDSKIYESDSAKIPDETLAFMSSVNVEKDKSDYIERTGSVAGFHTHQAKKNLDEIQKRTGKLSHPKARKELEKKLVFQAEKALIGDLSDENRTLKALTNLAEDKKDAFLSSSLSSLDPSSGGDAQYRIEVNSRIGEIIKGVSEGRLGDVAAQKRIAKIVDRSGIYRTNQLAASGDIKNAKIFAEGEEFSTPAAKERALNIAKKGYLEASDREGRQLKKQEQLENLKYKRGKRQISQLAANIIANPEMDDFEKQDSLEQVYSQAAQFYKVEDLRRLGKEAFSYSFNSIENLETDLLGVSAIDYQSQIFEDSESYLEGIVLDPKSALPLKERAQDVLQKITVKRAVLKAKVTRGYLVNNRKNRALDRELSKILQNPDEASLRVEGILELAKHRAERGPDAKRSFLGKEENLEVQSKLLKERGLKATLSSIYNRARKEEFFYFETNGNKEEALRKSKEYLKDIQEYSDGLDKREQIEKDIREKYK